MNIKGIEKKDIFIFIIGLLSLIKFRILGTFGASELIIFASYFFIDYSIARNNKQVRQMVLFAIVWLIGVFLSNLVNNTSTEDSLKGAFNVIFLILLFPFGYWALYDKPTRIMFFWAGVGVSSILGFRFQRMEMMNELSVDIWQVYAFKWIFLFLGGWFYYKGRRKLSYILLMAFGFWTMFHLSRNIFMLFSLVTAILLYIGKVDNSNFEYKFYRYKQGIARLLLVLCVAFIGITSVYESLASNGTLGEIAKGKYERQKNSKIGLASGRADFLSSLYAISKKPIFGYGSYAKDKNKLIEEFNDIMGLSSPTGMTTNKLRHVPAHSYMLGAWVNAGLLGFIFWVFILKKIFIYLRYHVLNEPRLLCLNLLLTSSMLWDIFFSPFSDRLSFAIYMMTISILSAPDYSTIIKVTEPNKK